MKLYELRKAFSCNKRRGFGFNPETEVSDFTKRSHLITDAAISILFGESEKDAHERYNEEFETLTFPTQEAREDSRDTGWKLIARFIDSTLPLTQKRVSVQPREVELSKDFEQVFVDPHYVIVGDGFTDNIAGVTYDGTIEVVKIHAGKATGAKEKNHDLAKYAMLKFGRTLVSPGKRVIITATDIYLRRNDDAGENASAPHFESDFYANGGGNVISVYEDYTGGLEETDTDKLFEKDIENYVEGIEEDECSDEDCESCNFYEICKYAEPPIQIVKEKKNRALRDLMLTPSQEEAIEYEEGIARANAGAGTGKTVVVALRTVTLLTKGYKPEEIVLMTFTNSGAEEMRERIQLYNDDIGTGEDISAMKICTFNSFGDDILKKEYKRFGFTDAPKVIDDVERSRIISKILIEHQIKGLNYKNFYTNTQYVKGAVFVAAKVFDIIKKGPYTVLDIDKVWDELGMDRRFAKKDAVLELIKLYDEYDNALREDNLIEFADQEMMLFELLEEDPYYLESLGYKHIIVDEFQDSSKRQIELLRKLVNAPSFKSLMVVGDDSQAIFGFRDTSPEYIIDFEKHIGEKIDDIYLLENHRCTPEIIDFANKVNEINTYRVAKDLIATRPHGKDVVVKGFHDKDSEKQYIIDGIKEHIAAGCKLEDIAIICSTKAELATYANLLTKEGIQSVSLNPEPLLDNSRVKAAISFVKCLHTENDTKDMLIYENAKLGGKVLTMDADEVKKCLEDAAFDVATVNETKLDEKAEKLLEILHEIDLNDDEIYQQFLETLSRKSFDKMVEYCEDFLVFGEKAEARRNHTYPGVVLTTCHSSKGLEWPIVYASITKFDDDSKGYHEPHRGSTLMAIEEQRRLLFVTATRARDELYVTSQYIAYGKKGEYKYNLFLKDSMKSNGMKYDLEAIQKEADDIALEKKKAKAEAKKLKEMEKIKEEYEASKKKK